MGYLSGVRPAQHLGRVLLPGAENHAGQPFRFPWQAPGRTRPSTAAGVEGLRRQPDARFRVALVQQRSHALDPREQAVPGPARRDRPPARNGDPDRASFRIPCGARPAPPAPFGDRRSPRPCPGTTPTRPCRSGAPFPTGCRSSPAGPPSSGGRSDRRPCAAAAVPRCYAEQRSSRRYGRRFPASSRRGVGFGAIHSCARGSRARGWSERTSPEAGFALHPQSMRKSRPMP
jgi:hypothetical protein